MTHTAKQCPCGTMKDYQNCCKPFHEGAVPQTALELMRSRYSAYALDLPDYIIATTHPTNPQYSKDTRAWKQSISQFSKEFTFNKLAVHDFKEDGNKAIVTFTAFISQAGRDATFTEKSYFEKENGRWFYTGGQVAQGYDPSFIKI